MTKTSPCFSFIDISMFYQRQMLFFIIFRLQEARLEVLKQLLKQREENHQELNIKRLDKLW